MMIFGTFRISFFDGVLWFIGLLATSVTIMQWRKWKLAILIHQQRRLLKRLKSIAALFLLMAFFLPLSSCKQTTTVAYRFVVNEMHDQQRIGVALIVLFAFIWPIILLFLAFFVEKRPKLQTVVTILEPSLCMGTLLVVIGLILWDTDLLYGTYIAVAAIVAYLVASLCETPRRKILLIRYVFLVLCFVSLILMD